MPSFPAESDLAPGGVGLHELQDDDALAVPGGAHGEAEGGRRLALAVAGVDLHQAGVTRHRDLRGRGRARAAAPPAPPLRLSI